MLLALGTTLIVVIALLSEVLLPRLEEWNERRKARRARVSTPGYDPGRERRAEQRARQLLRSCVNDEEWAMYRDLGFIRVWGREASRPGDPTATFNLGVALEDQGRIDEALQTYERAIALNAHNADAHYNAARLYEKEGDYGAALRHLRRAGLMRDERI